MSENLKDLYKQFFRIEPDNSITFIGNKLIVQIPQSFIDQNITQIINTSVSTFGIFEAYIFDDFNENDITKANHKFTSKIPSVLFMKPSHLEDSFVYVEDPETETLIKEKAINLVFHNGDSYIESMSLVKDTDNTDKWIVMLLNGRVPKTIRYDEKPKIWSKCNFLNNLGDAGSEFNTYSMIVANLERDPKNYATPFRLVLDKYYEKGIYSGKMIRYMDVSKHISNFTAVTGGDPKHGITVAMDRISRGIPDVKSPVEDVIV